MAPAFPLVKVEPSSPPVVTFMSTNILLGIFIPLVSISLILASVLVYRQIRRRMQERDRAILPAPATASDTVFKAVNTETPVHTPVNLSEEVFLPADVVLPAAGIVITDVKPVEKLEDRDQVQAPVLVDSDSDSTATVSATDSDQISLYTVDLGSRTATTSLSDFTDVKGSYAVKPGYYQPKFEDKDDNRPFPTALTRVIHKKKSHLRTNRDYYNPEFEFEDDNTPLPSSFADGDWHLCSLYLFDAQKSGFLDRSCASIYEEDEGDGMNIKALPLSQESSVASASSADSAEGVDMEEIKLPHRYAVWNDDKDDVPFIALLTALPLSASLSSMEEFELYPAISLQAVVNMVSPLASFSSIYGLYGVAEECELCPVDEEDVPFIALLTRLPLSPSPSVVTVFESPSGVKPKASDALSPSASLSFIYALYGDSEEVGPPPPSVLDDYEDDVPLIGLLSASPSHVKNIEPSLAIGLIAFDAISSSSSRSLIYEQYDDYSQEMEELAAQVEVDNNDVPFIALITALPLSASPSFADVDVEEFEPSPVVDLDTLIINVLLPSASPSVVYDQYDNYFEEGEQFPPQVEVDDDDVPFLVLITSLPLSVSPSLVVTEDDADNTDDDAHFFNCPDSIFRRDKEPRYHAVRDSGIAFLDEESECDCLIDADTKSVEARRRAVGDSGVAFFDDESIEYDFEMGARSGSKQEVHSTVRDCGVAFVADESEYECTDVCACVEPFDFEKELSLDIAGYSDSRSSPVVKDITEVLKLVRPLSIVKRSSLLVGAAMKGELEGTRPLTIVKRSSLPGDLEVKGAVEGTRPLTIIKRSSSASNPLGSVEDGALRPMKPSEIVKVWNLEEAWTATLECANEYGCESRASHSESYVSVEPIIVVSLDYEDLIPVDTPKVDKEDGAWLMCTLQPTKHLSIVKRSSLQSVECTKPLVIVKSASSLIHPAEKGADWRKSSDAEDLLVSYEGTYSGELITAEGIVERHLESGLVEDTGSESEFPEGSSKEGVTSMVPGVDLDCSWAFDSREIKPDSVDSPLPERLSEKWADSYMTEEEEDKDEPSITTDQFFQSVIRPASPSQLPASPSPSRAIFAFVKPSAADFLAGYCGAIYVPESVPGSSGGLFPTTASVGSGDACSSGSPYCSLLRLSSDTDTFFSVLSVKLVLFCSVVYLRSLHRQWSKCTGASLSLSRWAPVPILDILSQTRQTLEVCTVSPFSPGSFWSFVYMGSNSSPIISSSSLVSGLLIPPTRVHRLSCNVRDGCLSYFCLGGVLWVHHQVHSIWAPSQQTHTSDHLQPGSPNISATITLHDIYPLLRDDSHSLPSAITHQPQLPLAISIFVFVLDLGHCQTYWHSSRPFYVYVVPHSIHSTDPLVLPQSLCSPWSKLNRPRTLGRLQRTS